ncbi:tRNA lysidine(34) synthetase TilS [Aldersonia sp. NBC_00410]|uniref:tRNA lysidine(34) synthetase TilS n=1 Tax=Aldersonia sp. NBC_00410 TaxID=2975954 RepID=UPI00225672AE|nr:tRNA lysidine(34) synthetase TilS [Aldersonia sp. NBC_00410]MCX5043212.1 tRNA lysidine(34) synthetase TilS [Aldersonia sp. NBC_00410]
MDRASAGLAVLPETAAVLAVRRAVRAWLAETGAPRPVAVALSGGADSLALTAAAVVEAPRVHALIVDHGLQADSTEVAARAERAALRLGCATARVLPVRVGRSGGLEAAAREARYGALRSAATEVAEASDSAELPVLLGHTLDDQAETVLLGLARGSGGRSIHGMRAHDPPWGRPLLGVRRDQTRQLCADLDQPVYDDPHNFAPDFVRSRLRGEVLPLLEQVLGGGVAAALARTADQLRDDDDLLDGLAADALTVARVGGDLDVAMLAAQPPALRRRVIRAWLLDGGARALTAKHLHGVDDLVVRWRGQGGVAVGGGAPGFRLVASRRRGRLTLERSTDGFGPDRAQDTEAMRETD